MTRVREASTVPEDMKKFMGVKTPWHVAKRKKETTPGLKQSNNRRNRQTFQDYNVTIYIRGKPSMTTFKPVTLDCRNNAFYAAGMNSKARTWVPRQVTD